MEKNYLKAPERGKASEYKFTKNANIYIQEKKFKSMRKALESLNEEKHGGRKIIKYMTNNKLDPAVLATPKFISHESKTQQTVPLPTLQLNSFNIEKAMRELTELNNGNELQSSLSWRDDGLFEYQKSQLKIFKENLNIVQKSMSAHKPIFTSPEKEEPSPRKSIPKSPFVSKKVKSKKAGIERRIEGQKPLDDFLKESEPETAVPQITMALGSPRSAKAELLSCRLNMHPNQFDAESPGVFEYTETEMMNSRVLMSPMMKTLSVEMFDDLSEDNEKKGMITQRREKVRKMLQTTQQSRHIRVPNEKILTKMRYNTVLDSNLSPYNTEKMIFESKNLFFKDRYLNQSRKKAESPVNSYYSSAEKTKLDVFNGCKALSKACDANTKTSPSIHNAMKRSYRLLDESLAKLTNQLSSGEVEIDTQIKHDIVSEMQNLTSANAGSSKVGRKPKRPATSYNRGQ